MQYQHNIFGSGQDMDKKKDPDVWELFVDGAARKNPGPAGAGIFIRKNNEIYLKKGFYLAIRTNNQAEYLALLIGVILISECVKKNDTIIINSDSELMVKQIKGLYRVKQPELHILYQSVMAQLEGLPYTINHIFRSFNVVADDLANKGIDAQIDVPAYIQKKLPL